MAEIHPKLPDWHDRLAAVVNARMGQEPAWGTNDCVMWACDCVEAQTGFDYASAYRGRYSTGRGALMALRRIDGVELPIDLMDKWWGQRLHVSWAQHGDLIVAEGLSAPFDMGPSVGLCYGARSLFIGEGEHGDGLARLDTLSLMHCYRPWAS